MSARAAVPAPPPLLAVANIHPDYLESCLEGTCSGSKFQCHLPPGTVTLVRQTAGGRGGRVYGVVGLWYFTGVCEQMRAGRTTWSRRFPWRVKFEPLVHHFQERFCEDFSVPLPTEGGHRTHRASLHVPGLVFTSLQGTIVRVPVVHSANYLRALMKARGPELQGEADYLGSRVKLKKFLSDLAARLEEEAAKATPASS